MTHRTGYATQTEANVKPVQTEIPAELVEAQREWQAASDECDRLRALSDAAAKRYNEAYRRHSEAWSNFQRQVSGQVQELVGSREGT